MEKKKTSTDKVVETLQAWQDIENQTISHTTAVIAKTPNPLVKLVMEIIRHDSIMHHRVQQFIVESLTTRTVTLTPEELGDVWEQVEQHIKLERATIGFGEELMKSCKMFVQKELISYLLNDELKHDKLLSQLETLKKKSYPYG